MIVAGVKIWYADRTVARIRRGDLLTQWPLAPSDGVQCVAIFFRDTYQRWISDGVTEAGRPINQRLVTENYSLKLFNDRAGVLDLETGTFALRRSPVDVYWLDLVLQRIGAGLATDAPAGLPVGAIKLGSLISDGAFRDLATEFTRDRTAGTELEEARTR